MEASGYSNQKTVNTLLQWLTDKQDAGSASGAKKLKVEREKEQARQREIAAQERRKKSIEKAKSYPFFAIIKCTAFGNSMPLAACMVDGSRQTSIKLVTKNRSLDVPFFNLKSVGQLNKNQTTLKIDLPRRFVLSGQNASDQLKLELMVYDQVSEDLLKKSETSNLFGVVSATNN
mgnify:CR=1 FL=1